MNAIQAVAQNILHAQGLKSLKIEIKSNAIGQVIEYVHTRIPSETFQESLLYDWDTVILGYCDIAEEEFLVKCLWTCVVFAVELV